MDIPDYPRKDDFKFSGDNTQTRLVYLGLLDKKKRRRIISNCHGPELNEVAAVEIQRIWRGCRVRLKLRALLDDLLAEVQSEPKLDISIDLPSTSRDVDVFETEEKQPSPVIKSKPRKDSSFSFSLSSSSHFHFSHTQRRLSKPTTKPLRDTYPTNSPLLPPSVNLFAQPQTQSQIPPSQEQSVSQPPSRPNQPQKTKSQPPVPQSSSVPKRQSSASEEQSVPQPLSPPNQPQKTESQRPVPQSSSVPKRQSSTSQSKFQSVSSFSRSWTHSTVDLILSEHLPELSELTSWHDPCDSSEHDSEQVEKISQKEVNQKKREESKAQQVSVWPWSRRRRLQAKRTSASGSTTSPKDRKRGSLESSGSGSEYYSRGKQRRISMTKKTSSRLALEGAYDRYVQKALEKGESSTSMQEFTEYCAYRIQTWWLMKHRKFLKQRFSQRLQELQKKATLESAAVMEAMIKEKSEASQRKLKRGKTFTEREAAISIQRAWRRHIDIQVYRYYRDLINFKSRGNPAVMLRCINPNEAKLLDPASGSSVRFRLAGDRFPPNIYYKIFTHRPIQDMCANSPKDYTRPQAKQLNVRHRHNNIATIPIQEDNKENWYQRIENNGWRLVSDRLIHHILNDPITWESSRKTYKFDHSKLKRKQDVEKEKKLRKIDWMKKMYQQGMLRARADDQETVQLIEGAAAGMMATVDSQGPDALEDWEVDELLDWTTSLNFEDYFSTWKDLATSAPADNQLAVSCKSSVE